MSARARQRPGIAPPTSDKIDTSTLNGDRVTDAPKGPPSWVGTLQFLTTEGAPA